MIPVNILSRPMIRPKFTMTEIGVKLNLTPSAVSSLLNPKRDPHLSTLRKLSKAYGISIEELANNYIDKNIYDWIA